MGGLHPRTSSGALTRTRRPPARLGEGPVSAYEAQRASSGGPTLLNFHTSPFVHRKYMNGRLRPPAAAVRHAACLRRREESNDRCFVSSLAPLMTTASGRVATPISSAPARRTLQTTKVPRVEASTSTTMESNNRRERSACLRRREESNDRCFVSSLTLLMATASGRVATPISSAPARRTLQTTKVPRVEASTSTTMEVEQPKRTFCLLASRTRRRPAAVRHAACLVSCEAVSRQRR